MTITSYEDVELGDDLLHAHLRSANPAATQTDELGGALDVRAEEIDVDIVVLELLEDLLELGQRVGIAELVVTRPRCHAPPFRRRAGSVRPC